VFGLRKDGTEFPAEITISKLEQGGETLFTAIVRDITERKRYEEQILRLNEELEDRVKARTAELAERNVQLAQKNEENEMFVYSVSHDLRSPLVNLEVTVPHIF
jgi:signal transduction histidine kinase